MYDMINIQIQMGMIVMITSTQNSFIKDIRKLRMRKERHKTNSFLIEGFHLLEEAVKSDWEIEQLIIKENMEVPKWGKHLTYTYVTEHVFSYLSQTETPQGIAGVVKMRDVKVENNNKILLLDAIQDPGNLGTIIRTADAAGFNHIVLGKGTVDLFNDKVIRATQGSMFHVQIEQEDLLKKINELKEDGFTVYASALQNAVSYRGLEPEKKAALILGNEGAGIAEEVLQAAHICVNVPIYGKAESLNVGVAAGILMYALL